MSAAGVEAGMGTASSAVQLLGSYTFLSLAQMEQCWHCSEGAALPVLTHGAKAALNETELKRSRSNTWAGRL